MESTHLVGLLALFTLLAVIVFAVRSKFRVEKEKDNPNHTKSTLAADAPNERRPDGSSPSAGRS